MIAKNDLQPDTVTDLIGAKVRRMDLPSRACRVEKVSSPNAVAVPRALRVLREKPKPTAEIDFREVDLMSLDHQHCRWPREKAGAPGGFVYCGQQRSDVSAYCPDHNIIAYQPSMPRRKNVN
jgi:hypothetical protein